MNKTKYKLKYPEKPPNKKVRRAYHKRGSKWWPCRVTSEYRDNFDGIRWDK